FTSASVAMVFFLALSLLRDRAGERERVVSARG
ncbi:MAG: hypothetical protein ACI9C1_003980, partial [Candidatus Aldehydirespiratoraceae bacterium]